MSEPASRTQPLVLFVEDEHARLRSAGTQLKSEFRIETVRDLEQALEAASKLRPELIVIDFTIARAAALTRQFRQQVATAFTPILMISRDLTPAVNEGFEAGADSYLAESNDVGRLRARLHSLLRNAKARLDAVREALVVEDRRALEQRVSVFDSMTEAFYSLDHEWRITLVNQPAADYFNLPREALLGRVIWEVFPALRGTIAQHESERAMRERVNLDLEFQSPVSRRWLEMHGYPYRDGLAVHFRDISERKQAEIQLRESVHRLRLMSDALPALVSYIDADYRYRFCNRRYEEWFGVSAREVTGRTMEEILGTAAFKALQPYADRALAGEQVALETRVPYRTGGARDIQVNYVPERDEAGRVRGYFALVQDITERKSSERRLRESEARFHSMADDAPMMVWVTEADGSCSFLSRSWCDFTGQRLARGLGSGWLDAVHPEDRLQSERAFLEASAGRKSFRLEYRLRHADGKYAWAMHAASPRFNEEGEFLGYIGSVIDIQERRQMEQQLRELNERLEQRISDVVAERKVFADLIEGTHAFVQVADTNFRWLAINRASADEFERIYGIRPRVGDNMLELLADRPEQQAAVKAIWSRALAGEEFTQVQRFGDPNYEQRFYEMKFNSLRGRTGRLIGAYQFVFDVSDRQRDETRLAEAQEALRQSQKMETLGQLTGGVAHDFNNLLTPIVGVLDLLSRRHPGDSRVERLTSNALQAADRAKILIQRLLAFARRQHLAAQPVDLRELFDGIRDLLARSIGPHIELSIHVDSQLRPAHVDPNQLELALLNLAVNARDAMPEGGLMTVRASEEWMPGSSRLSAGRYVRICVQDTGVGMDAQTLQRAIEPFFTTKGIGQGTGLGLSMVHGLAAQSGGDFVLESKPGRGTTATLWLPLSKQTVSRADEAMPPSAPLRALRDTVLLVDDEPLVRVGTAAMLVEGGYEVLEASSADEALGLLREGFKVDVIVTDFAMPGRNGAQLAREARVLRPALPTLMITGFASLTDAESAGLPRLAKPFRQTELLASVAQTIAAGSGVA